MMRARSGGSRRLLVMFVLLAALAAMHLARPATAQTRPGAQAPPAGAPAAAPTTAPAGDPTDAVDEQETEEEEDTGPYVMPTPPPDTTERDFWLQYVAVPVLAMLAVIAVGVLILFRIRGRRGRPQTTTTPPTTTTPGNPPPPAS